jgi:outer membrane cobalamin receptor
MSTRVVICLSIIAFLGIYDCHAQQEDSLKTEDILGMSLADLMNTTVISASKTSQSVRNVPATVYVITAKQITDRAYFTLDEALSDLPGLQFRNIEGFNSYIFMRGAPSQNNLIILMVDGIQINELNSGGFYGGGQFNLSDVEQIEVVYGPASALYGTNAVSGIINIITKKPDRNEGHISILGGNFKTGMANFDLSRYNASKDMGFSVSGQYKTTEKADLGGAKGDNNWTEEMENFENDISAAAKFKLKDFSSGIIYQEKRSSNTTSFKSVDDVSYDRNTLWDITFLNAYLKYSNTRHEKWSETATAYYRNATVEPNTVYQVLKSTATYPGRQTGYYRPNNLLGLENQFNYRPVKPLMLIGGIIGETEYLSESFSVTYSNSQEEKPPEPPHPNMLRNYLFSYYAQAEYSFLKYFSFTTGIRHDFSNYYGQVFIPRFGLVFNYEKLSAKALYNRAFRAPRPWDYYYGTGNNDLKPEKMKSLEFCLSLQANENVIFTGSVFDNVIDDKLTREVSPTVDRWVNKDVLNTTGFELSGNYSSGRLGLSANYSFNDSRNQDDIFIPEISKHTANAGVTVSIIESLKLNLRANYLGDRINPFIIPSTGTDKIDDAFLLHGCLSFTGIKNLLLQLKMNNLLNEEYYHSSNRIEGRYRQPQRSVILFATYDFRFKKR